MVRISGAAPPLGALMMLSSTHAFFISSPVSPQLSGMATPFNDRSTITSCVAGRSCRCCCACEEGGSRVRRYSRRPKLPMLAAGTNTDSSGTSGVVSRDGRASPPLETLNNENERVRRNLERIRQVEVDGTRTIRAITSSALRGKLRLSGRDKRGRVFLPGDVNSATLDTLNRMLKETFPLGDFPIALYVKTSLEENAKRSPVASDEQLRAAISWADAEGVDLHTFLDVHPDFREEEAPEWLVDVPDPTLAEEWEMLSFYRFVDIEQPEAFANMLQLAWTPLGVRGRVYVASEGINAQMAVPCTSAERFERAVEAVEKLEGVYLNKAERRWNGDEFLASPPFPALHVRARKQIVADGLSEPLEWSDGSGKVGKGLSPEEWHDMMEEEKTATLLDCRNSYESVVGTFDKALPLDTSFFRESWGELERLVGDADRDAPIMTYCTGGIRCVKIAAYLEQEMGFTNVSRLEGGIVSYSKFAKERGLESKFKGVNYVFDKRMGDKVTSDTLSSCHQCGQPCAEHTNCANPCCHARLIQCESCADKYGACCSRGCKEQYSRKDLRESLMNRERLAIGLPSKASSSAGVVGGDSLEAVAGVGDEEMGEDRIGGDIEEPVVENGEESEPLWLAWPFQDPTLNLMFDRAFDEFRDSATAADEEQLLIDNGVAKNEGSSRMAGIVARMGGVRRALAVGLGSGGPAGRANLRRLVEALEDGGELVVVEASSDAAKAARGLSLVSGSRGCRITVFQCDEASILERVGEGLSAPARGETSMGAAPVSDKDQAIAGQGGIGTTSPRALPDEALFDVVFLGGGDGVISEAGDEREGAGRISSPGERLDLVLDRRLIKRTGLVLCDPCALAGGEVAARAMAARAMEVKGTVEHARVPGTGPCGGLHIFKWKTYSH